MPEEESSSEPAEEARLAAPDFTGTLADDANMQVLACLGPARQNRLFIYAGAGISWGSGLPNGSQLAQLIFDRLVSLGVDLTGVNRTDLLAVADKVAAVDGGLVTLQHEALHVAAFTSAPPNAAHEAFALLLLEDAIELLTTNWDTCVERAAPQGEQIVSVVTDEDRRLVSGKALLKVHGCALRAKSVLLTTDQLSAPLIWSDTAIAAGLSNATVVFVGIGDVAPYVRVRIQQVIEQAGAREQLAVVAPDIVEAWENSQWQDVLPDGFPSERLWPLTADEFSQRLVCGWVNSALNECAQHAKGIGPELAVRLASLRAVLSAYRGVDVLAWMRRSAAAVTPGVSVAHAGSMCEALLALALLIDPSAPDGLPDRGPWRSGEQWLDLVVAVRPASAGEVADAAYRRADRFRTRGLVGPGESLKMICSGNNAGLSKHAQLPADIVSDDGGDTVGGGAVELIDARMLLEGAA